MALAATNPATVTRMTSRRKSGRAARWLLEGYTRLDGEVAVVTGGAGHVGAMAATVFVEQGAKVVIMDKEDVRASMQTRELLRRYKGRVFFEPVDLASLDSSCATMKRVVRLYGRLDVFVHCAAFVGTTNRDGWSGPLSRQRPSVWGDAFQVNVTAAFAMVQAALPFLRRAKPGRVILVSSIYGVGGPVPELYEGTTMSNPVAYGASKGALIQLVRYLAVELGPLVRVNALSPGGIYRGQPPAFVRKYEKRTPLRRMAREEDLAGAFLFLASRLSNYVTGQNLIVDGGWTAS
jgi:NAD(P)-dependent dehydrogenase (short-subunit alcohol dehydrogenase family)